MTWSSDQKWGVPRGALLHDAVEDTPPDDGASGIAF